MMNLNHQYYYILLLNFLILIIMILPFNFFKFHPLLMNLLLMFYILIITIKLNFYNSITWYSYILFLVMIGGLMILFMYFTSLANNQFFNINLNFLLNIFMKFIFMMITFIIFWKNINILLILNNLFTEIYSMYYIMMNLNMNMMKNLMMDYFMDLNLYIIMYLFFTMICVMILCMKNLKAMRQNIKY